jgi:hypothetical protein
MKNMERTRTALARMLTILMIPTMIYVIIKMGDPEYCPAIGWALGMLTLLFTETWGLINSKLFFTFVNTRD